MGKADVTGMTNYWFETDDPFVPSIDIDIDLGPWMAVRVSAATDANLGDAFWFPKDDADRAAALAAVFEEAAADLRQHVDFLRDEGE